ncbi:hypothetical protein [Haloplanus litoreus]|uniref:Uncharacterized protein n=1 Tax=Haloplanus litoreus TaxID=767515 RepID=A0ABD6A4N0_9EURY
MQGSTKVPNAVPTTNRPPPEKAIRTLDGIRYGFPATPSSQNQQDEAEHGVRPRRKVQHRTEINRSEDERRERMLTEGDPVLDRK